MEGISQPHPPTSASIPHPSPLAWVRKQNKLGPWAAPRAEWGSEGPQRKRDKETEREPE